MWWCFMVFTGLVLGAFAAWSQGRVRLFMKTLSVPAAMLILYTVFKSYAPKNILEIFLEMVILATSGFLADYFVGLRLGRHGIDGMRQDSVGH